ncbi:MAG: flagellar hook-length control protein FliK [Pseudomonadota bacterium]|uniref:flagellar hook-length control protein FliK n=1 Tax=Phenylobacterium sp. TaxID=1871053 RepID=UPI0025DD5C70|nr:flagellar hook-length control protein FliK [Phenylobacterium sp.]MBT9470664.1 flagellar hook-length control protein FliK [Phenylobacterium sp.]
MTAPIFNLPMTSPIAGNSTANAAQGPMAGFEALLAAFFGEPGDLAAGAGLFGDGQVSDEDAAKTQTGLADAQSTPTLSTEAQVLAAMLAAPAPQIAQAAANAAASTASEGEAAGGSPPAPAIAFVPPGPAVTPLAPQATAEASDLPAPKVDPSALATADAQTATAAAATDPDLAVPTAATAPDTKTPAKSPVATAPQAAAPQPIAQTPPPAPTTAPVAAQVMAQAETVAAEPAAEAEPAAPHGAPRNAKSADLARRTAGQAAAPVAPADDAALPSAVTAVANASASGEAASSVETETAAPAAPRDAKAATDAPDFQAPAPAAATHAAAPAAHAAPVKATPETVAHLTAQISKKLDGQSTKFDVELNPAGLGRVSVSVEIAASGKMTAAMSFESPQAAAELRARSNELQRALEQAGFDLSGGLSFDVAGDRGDGRGAAQQQQNDGAAWRGRAFQAVLGTAGEAVESASSLALNYGRRSTTGVDVRI